MNTIRELTLEERMVLGHCPICHAEHGDPCHPGVGIPLGRLVSGLPPTEGVHLGRIQRAPRAVQLVPVP